MSDQVRGIVAVHHGHAAVHEKMIENRRILVVDDEPYNILGLKIVLSQSRVKNILSIIDTAFNG